MLLNKLEISGKTVWPIFEGGRGICVSTGVTAGAFAKEDCVGTISGVNPDFFNEDGILQNCIYNGKTRAERQRELIEAAIKGGIDQAKIAHDMSCGKGRIHFNVLWEMGGCEEILTRVLEKTKGLIHGVTCGAGMPYKLAEIAASHGVYYYPIVSSARAFSALFKRSYKKFVEFLGGVVYEDPWLAGGHNGISNTEDPNKPERPYGRLVKLRELFIEFGLDNIPIILAGGVWNLSEFSDYINNKEIGNIAFQFGTRSLLVKENPIAEKCKEKLLSLKKGDILLNQLSPTGFFSSAVKNKFLTDLIELNNRQIYHSEEGTEELVCNGRVFKISVTDAKKAKEYINDGFSELMITPDNSVVFVTKEQYEKIRKDQRDCVGCLSACRFSSWSQKNGTTGIIPDPRSFCIQKTLQDISHNGNVEDNLLFCGHSGYRFANDSLYKNKKIPSTKELIENILSGN